MHSLELDRRRHRHLYCTVTHELCDRPNINPTRRDVVHSHDHPNERDHWAEAVARTTSLKPRGRHLRLMAKIQIVPRRSFTTTTQSWPSMPRLACHGQSSCQILIYPTFGVPQLPKWSLNHTAGDRVLALASAEGGISGRNVLVSGMTLSKIVAAGTG